MRKRDRARRQAQQGKDIAADICFIIVLSAEGRLPMALMGEGSDEDDGPMPERRPKRRRRRNGIPYLYFFEQL